MALRFIGTMPIEVTNGAPEKPPGAVPGDRAVVGPAEDVHGVRPGERAEEDQCRGDHAERADGPA